MALTPIMPFRLNGVPKEILETLVQKGVYKTRTEAVRVALLELGKKHKIYDGTYVIKK